MTQFNPFRKNNSWIVFADICLVGLVLIGGLFLYKLKFSQFQPEKRSPSLILTPSLRLPGKQLIPPTLIPTPTLAADQRKAVYTFYIQTTSRKINSKGLNLNPSDSGKTLIVDIGTTIFLEHFGLHHFSISQTSPQNIFTDPNPGGLPGSLPADAIASFRVYQSGFGTIMVIEAK